MGTRYYAAGGASPHRFHSPAYTSRPLLPHWRYLSFSSSGQICDGRSTTRIIDEARHTDLTWPADPFHRSQPLHILQRQTILFSVPGGLTGYVLIARSHGRLHNPSPQSLPLKGAPTHPCRTLRVQLTDGNQTRLSTPFSIRRCCLHHMAIALDHLETLYIQSTIPARTETSKLASG